ncbi:MAG: hypothetical protein LBU32_16030 [Clostridiales bacterium]|nr:hypothetical protein [Clostridiales bacterium]
MFTDSEGLEGASFVLPSASCASFAVFADGSKRIKVYGSTNFNLICDVDANADSRQSWIGDEFLLYLSGNALYILDAADGSTHELKLPDADGRLIESVVSAAASLENGWIAIAEEGAAAIFELYIDSLPHVGGFLKELPVLSRILYIQADHRFNPLLAECENAFYMYDMGMLRSDESAAMLKEIGFTGGKRVLGAVAVDKIGDVYFGEATGRVAVSTESFATAEGREEPAYLKVAVPAIGAVKAHGGQTLGICAFSEGAWASIGSDSMLRVWERPIFQNPRNAALAASAELHSDVWPGLEQAKRCTLGLIGSGEIISLRADGSCYAIIKRETLETEKFFPLWANITRAKATRSGKIVALRGGVDCSSVMSADISSALQIMDNTAMLEEAPQPVIDLSLYDLSDDGSELAAIVAVRSDRGLLYIWNVEAGGYTARQLDAETDIVYRFSSNVSFLELDYPLSGAKCRYRHFALAV